MAVGEVAAVLQTLPQWFVGKLGCSHKRYDRRVPMVFEMVCRLSSTSGALSPSLARKNRCATSH